MSASPHQVAAEAEGVFPCMAHYPVMAKPKKRERRKVEETDFSHDTRQQAGLWTNGPSQQTHHRGAHTVERPPTSPRSPLSLSLPRREGAAGLAGRQLKRESEARGDYDSEQNTGGTVVSLIRQIASFVLVMRCSGRVENDPCNKMPNRTLQQMRPNINLAETI